MKAHERAFHGRSLLQKVLGMSKGSFTTFLRISISLGQHLLKNFRSILSVRISPPSSIRSDSSCYRAFIIEVFPAVEVPKRTTMSPIAY